MTEPSTTPEWPKPEAEPKPPRRKRWYVLGVAAVLVGLYLTFFVALGNTYTVPSESMSPSYPPGSRIWATRFGSAERGAVVIFRHPDRHPGDPELLIKRIVAVGGDEVSAPDGRLEINGRPVAEPYLAPGTRTIMQGSVAVPAGSVYLLGDGREISLDSRIWGPVADTEIVAYVRF